MNLDNLLAGSKSHNYTEIRVNKTPCSMFKRCNIQDYMFNIQLVTLIINRISAEVSSPGALSSQSRQLNAQQTGLTR